VLVEPTRGKAKTEKKGWLSYPFLSVLALPRVQAANLEWNLFRAVEIWFWAEFMIRKVIAAARRSRRLATA
jgi:hypothetical protein